MGREVRLAGIRKGCQVQVEGESQDAGDKGLMEKPTPRREGLGMPADGPEEGQVGAEKQVQAGEAGSNPQSQG